MEWTNRLLKSSSSRGVKQLKESSTSSARGATVNDLNSHNGHNHDRNDANGCQATSSPMVGNGNRNTTASSTPSCAVENRTTTTSTGTPVRTVSISRSGRYKSKSKQRARLLSSDVDQFSTSGMTSITNTSYNSPSVHHQQQQQQHIQDTRATSSPSRSSEELISNSSTAISVRRGTDDHPERTGSSAIGHVTSGRPASDQSLSNSTTIDGKHNPVIIPYYSAAGDDVIDDVSFGLQVAFESTNL